MGRKASGRRFIWMSCSVQTPSVAPGRSPISYITGNGLYSRIMNRIAKELVMSNGFEFFDQLSFLSVALLQRMWWDNKDGYVTGDIHHHERHCPKAHNSTFPLLGDKVYLSKVKAQLLFR